MGLPVLAPALGHLQRHGARGYEEVPVLAPDGNAECLWGAGGFWCLLGSCCSMSAQGALSCHLSAFSGTWNST